MAEGFIVDKNKSYFRIIYEKKALEPYDFSQAL